ncbi:MAG: ABC transporter permease [Tenericutes bacterium HGW-Tenericutes-1]|nr:MAG: ABC transporter permease [Tenericutes bacterium HGW-Tenericutes-1]
MNIKKLGKLVLPYLVWMSVLVGLPLLMMVVLTFLKSNALDLGTAEFSFDSWRILFSDVTVRIALKNSFVNGIIATIICFVIGYPIAYIVANSNFSNKLIILVLTIIPMWSNSLLRNNAIANILSERSIVNDVLSNIGLNFIWPIRGVVYESGFSPAVVIGLVLTYLPFMILPIYTVLEKIDKSLLEASMDLGSNKIKTFFKVTFPLSIKGVTTGIIMVFLPSFSGFAIPKILGSGSLVFIGTLIDSRFMNRNYNFGSLLSLVILLIIFGSMALIFKVDKEGETLI